MPPADNWLPRRWDDVVGNGSLKRHLRGLVKGIRFSDEPVLLNTLVTGASRSGKTSLFKLFVGALLCGQLDRTTLNACGDQCDRCRDEDRLYGGRGLFLNPADVQVHYVPIDCTTLTPAELSKLLIELRGYGGKVVVYLDEVDHLHKRGIDAQLLKPLEELDFLWIASTANPQNLEQMFKNRFTRFRTTRPTIDELCTWIEARCRGQGVQCEDPSAVERLVHRCDRVPGLALQVINRALATDERALTFAVVEECFFDDE